MKANPDFATIAALIADPARAAMPFELIGDIALPAGELARLAKVTPQTASTHLAKLVKGNLVSVTKSGRHRYFRLSNRDVAQALEKLALIAPPTHLHSLNETLERKAIHRARTCCDHLAGELGVGLTQAFIDKGFIHYHDGVYEVTEIGENWAILQRSLELRWIARISGSRAIKVTEAGRNHLRKEFGLEWK